MTVRELWPSLQMIHARFNADTALPSDKAALLSDVSLSRGEDENILPEPPAMLNDLFARRAATEHHLFGPSPQVGQVVLIQDRSGTALPSVLTVLLDEQVKGNQWAGWLVVPDTDYATYWDVLLDHRDEPFDPEAGMIQIWNPVFVDVPVGAQVVAQLTPERLSVVRAVAAEYASADRAVDEDASPGKVAPRSLASGAVAITGTPLGDASDPRRVYQSYYMSAASRLRSTSSASNVIQFPGRVKSQATLHDEEGFAVAALLGRREDMAEAEAKKTRFSPELVVSVIINVLLLIAIVMLLVTSQQGS